MNQDKQRRNVIEHIVPGDTSTQLHIEVVDSPGAGGACHRYGIGGFQTKTNASADSDKRDETYLTILFQNGPIGEQGVNGITQEALLAVVIDRLRSFQSGPFSCRENAIALTHCEDALMWLQKRTVNRIKRGVEGTDQK